MRISNPPKGKQPVNHPRLARHEAAQKANAVVQETLRVEHAKDADTKVEKQEIETNNNDVIIKTVKEAGKAIVQNKTHFNILDGKCPT